MILYRAKIQYGVLFHHTEDYAAKPELWPKV